MKKRDVIEIVVAFLAAWLFYQGLAFATGTEMPMVSVVSDSMYHMRSFETWWNWNSEYYEPLGITEQDFLQFTLPNGLSRGDLLVVVRPDDIKVGDIVVYRRTARDITIVHRIVKVEGDTYIIKGDNNPSADSPVRKEMILGKVVAGAPLLGYPRLLLSFTGI